MTDFVTRFAPSPTGLLHLGHAAAAWHVWHAAERANGKVLLRIEDIDTTRCRPEYTAQIFEDLKWLGFEWPQPVRTQSEHFAEYAETVAHLADLGLAYRCFRTRAELANSTPGPLPPSEEAKNRHAEKPYAWRLSLVKVREHLGSAWNDLSYTLETKAGLQTIPADPHLHGDIVIARKDSPSAYHLAATQDDALQKITHVIRGDDLADAAHIQTLLQVLMGWQQPIYQHHDLVLGQDGKRLSKTDRSVSLIQLRENGMSAADIWHRLDLE